MDLTTEEKLEIALPIAGIIVLSAIVFLAYRYQQWRNQPTAVTPQTLVHETPIPAYPAQGKE